MTRTAPVTPLPWPIPAARARGRSQQRLPARSPHTILALFLATCSLACPPLGSLCWWYAGNELDRIAAGELWAHGSRALVPAKGIGVAMTTACATFLACAALSRLL
jgi:hypothetical protein